MSTEIIKQLPATLTEAINMGKVFYESGLFTDLKSAAQAVVKIQAGAEIGIPPFAALSGIHIIQGKPTIGAGIIASKVKSSGKYDYKVVKMTDIVCSLEFYQGKELLGSSTFDLVDAKKAGTKNLDKFPKNMLFARAISNGVKWFCPDVFNGPVYTPEEIESITEDVEAEEIKNKENGKSHTEIRPGEKPLISEPQFEKLMERIRNGDTKAYYQAIEVFTLESTQQELLETEFAKLIDKEEPSHAR